MKIENMIDEELSTSISDELEYDLDKILCPFDDDYIERLQLIIDNVTTIQEKKNAIKKKLSSEIEEWLSVILQNTRITAQEDHTDTLTISFDVGDYPAFEGTETLESIFWIILQDSSGEGNDCIAATNRSKELWAKSLETLAAKLRNTKTEQNEKE